MSLTLSVYYVFLDTEKSTYDGSVDCPWDIIYSEESLGKTASES